MKIKVTLPKTRTFPGTLTVEGLDKEIKCLGKADQFAADKAGNKERDPAKHFGDTPLGEFKVELAGVGASIRSYGPNKRFLLLGVPGREGIMVHGGAPGNGGGLRPTDGCLRVSNDDMAWLIENFKTPCTIDITESTPNA